MQLLRAELRQELREHLTLLRDHFDERFDSSQDERDRMHRENLAQMVRIEEQCRETNGRVSKLEEAMRNVREEFQRIRDKWHDFRATIQRQVDGFKRIANISSDERPITRKELGMVIGLAIGVGTMAVSITLWILFFKIGK